MQDIDDIRDFSQDTLSFFIPAPPSPLIQAKPTPMDMKKGTSNKLFINTQVPNPETKNLYSSQAQQLFYSAAATGSPVSTAKRKATNGPRFLDTKQFRSIVSSDEKTEDNDVGYKVNLDTRVEGGFFWPDGIATCYRRNYFRALTSLSLTKENETIHPDHPLDQLSVLVDPVQNIRKPISEFSVELCAGSNLSHQRKIDLIIQLTKRENKIPPAVPSFRRILPGGSVSEDPSPPKTPLTPVGQFQHFKIQSQQSQQTQQTQSQNCMMEYNVLECTKPTIVSFDRVQFRTATANNGKRKTIQQYFHLKVELYATTIDGDRYKIAESTSESVVVRGRSPSHYADAERIRDKKRVDVFYNSNISAGVLDYGGSGVGSGYGGGGPVSAYPLTQHQSLISANSIITPMVNRRSSWASLIQYPFPIDNSSLTVTAMEYDHIQTHSQEGQQTETVHPKQMNMTNSNGLIRIDETSPMLDFDISTAVDGLFTEDFSDFSALGMEDLQTPSTAMTTLSSSSCGASIGGRESPDQIQNLKW